MFFVSSHRPARSASLVVVVLGLRQASRRGGGALPRAGDVSAAARPSRVVRWGRGTAVWLAAGCSPSSDKSRSGDLSRLGVGDDRRQGPVAS